MTVLFYDSLGFNTCQVFHTPMKEALSSGINSVYTIISHTPLEFVICRSLSSPPSHLILTSHMYWGQDNFLMSDRVWNLPKVITHCSCSWGSWGKNTGVVGHSLLQWTTFWNSPLWHILLGWPCMAWLIASLSYASPFARTRLWSKKGKDWRQKEKSLVEDEMVGWYHRPRDMNLNKFWETVKGMEVWIAVVHGVGQDLATEHTHRHITHEKQEWQLDILSYVWHNKLDSISTMWEWNKLFTPWIAVTTFFFFFNVKDCFEMLKSKAFFFFSSWTL